MNKRFLALAIIVLAILLRFINYDNRWGLAADQAGFALTGTHALRTHQLPLLGPFSSGGPFQTGGIWYWLVSAGNILFPGIIQGPWIFMTILSAVFVAVMILAGTILGGTSLGLITGLLTAVSTAQIAQSANLSNQTPIALPAAAALIAAMKYVKTKSPIYLFFIGLGIGIAMAIHLQGAGLLPIAVVAIVLAGLPTMRGLLLLALGLILPWVSVLLADAGNNWYNTTNMIRYYAVDQYKISLDVLGRRWLTFGAQFIPDIWSFTIGGFRWVGIVTILFGTGVAAYHLLKRAVTQPWLLVVVSFAGSLTMARYARVPLFDSFVIFFHPFILLLSAGIVWSLLRRTKPLGIALLVLLVAGSMIKNYEEIRRATNISAPEAKRQRTVLTSFFPGKKIALYDFSYKNTSASLPLLLYLEQQSLTSPNGVRVGISYADPRADIHPIIDAGLLGANLYDLSGSSSAQLAEAQWAYIDAKVIYENVQHWYKKQ